MTGENLKHTKQDSPKRAARRTDEYDRTEGGAIMRSAKIILCILSILGVCALAQRTGVPSRAARLGWRFSSQTPAQPPAKGKRIVIAASAVLDGKGRVLHDTRIADSDPCYPPSTVCSHVGQAAISTLVPG
jgi:hypothetical protein